MFNILINGERIQRIRNVENTIMSELAAGSKQRLRHGVIQSQITKRMYLTSYHSSLSHLPTAHLEVVTIMMFSRLLGSGSGKDLSEGKKRWTCLT